MINGIKTTLEEKAVVITITFIFPLLFSVIILSCVAPLIIFAFDLSMLLGIVYAILVISVIFLFLKGIQRRWQLEGGYEETDPEELKLIEGKKHSTAFYLLQLFLAMIGVMHVILWMIDSSNPIHEPLSVYTFAIVGTITFGREKFETLLEEILPFIG